MSVQVSRVYDCPGEVETVFAALSGPGWAQRRSEVLHDDSTTVRRDVAADGGVTLAVSRALPDGAPGFLQRFLPSDGRVVQTDTWGPDQAGVRHGTWRADLPGAPAEISGTMRLEPAAGATRYSIEGAVKVRVPLIGGKAERFLAELIGKLTDKEHEVLMGMLR